jgi:hypothetical protein
MWVVLMISSLRVTRVSPDRAQSLSLARLDYALSDGPLAQGTVMDPRIVNPQLEEIVSEAARRAETAARERGYAAGYQQARDEITATVRDELGRENEVLRAEHEALIANQADVRNQLIEAVQLMQALAFSGSVSRKTAHTYWERSRERLQKSLRVARSPCVSIRTTLLCSKDSKLIWRTR